MIPGYAQGRANRVRIDAGMIQNEQQKMVLQQAQGQRRLQTAGQWARKLKDGDVHGSRLLLNQSPELREWFKVGRGETLDFTPDPNEKGSVTVFRRGPTGQPVPGSEVSFTQDGLGALYERANPGASKQDLEGQQARSAARLQPKMEQIAAIRTDRTLTDEQQLQKIDGIIAEIRALNADTERTKAKGENAAAPLDAQARVIGAQGGASAAGPNAQAQVSDARAGAALAAGREGAAPVQADTMGQQAGAENEDVRFRRGVAASVRPNQARQARAAAETGAVEAEGDATRAPVVQDTLNIMAQGQRGAAPAVAQAGQIAAGEGLADAKAGAAGGDQRRTLAARQQEESAMGAAWAALKSGDDQGVRAINQLFGQNLSAPVASVKRDGDKMALLGADGKPVRMGVDANGQGGGDAVFNSKALAAKYDAKGEWASSAWGLLNKASGDYVILDPEMAGGVNSGTITAAQLSHLKESNRQIGGYYGGRLDTNGMFSFPDETASKKARAAMSLAEELIVRHRYGPDAAFRVGSEFADTFSGDYPKARAALLKVVGQGGWTGAPEAPQEPDSFIKQTLLNGTTADPTAGGTSGAAPGAGGANPGPSGGSPTGAIAPPPASMKDRNRNLPVYPERGLQDRPPLEHGVGADRSVIIEMVENGRASGEPPQDTWQRVLETVANMPSMQRAEVRGPILSEVAYTLGVQYTPDKASPAAGTGEPRRMPTP